MCVHVNLIISAGPINVFLEREKIDRGIDTEWRQIIQARQTREMKKKEDISCMNRHLFFLWLFSVSGTLMIQQILVPVQVMSGSNVVLRCLFAEIGSNSTLISGNHKHNLPEYDSSVIAAAGPLYSLKVGLFIHPESSFIF